MSMVHCMSSLAVCWTQMAMATEILIQTTTSESGLLLLGYLSRKVRLFHASWLDGEGSVAVPSGFYSIVIRCTETTCPVSSVEALGLLLHHRNFTSIRNVCVHRSHKSMPPIRATMTENVRRNRKYRSIITACWVM